MTRDPFRELFAVSFPAGTTSLFDAPGGAGGSWLPPLDVFETKAAYVVVVDVPGVPASKLDVTLEAGVLTVRGERRFHTNVNEDSFHRVERRFGQFSRSVALPSAKVDPEGVVARVADGVLTIDVPKAEAAQTRHITVREEQTQAPIEHVIQPGGVG